MSRNTITIPVNVVTPSKGDLVRINARHMAQLSTLAERGNYTSLATLVNAILDHALPRVQLVELPRYELVIANEDDGGGSDE